MFVEEFRDVVGFEEYFQVSNLGRVWSKRTNKILAQGTLKSGYKVISTRIGGRDGKAHCLRVHRMVADAFLPPPSEELVEVCGNQHYGKVIVRHLDNCKINNKYTNLSWGTCQDNSNDYVESGKSAETALKFTGILNPISKLSLEDIEFIRCNYKPYCTEFGARALGKRFNVAHSCISKVVRRVSYK